jgi:membrane protease YdiL (CAAX protease family)
MSALHWLAWFHLGYFGLVVPGSAIHSRLKLVGAAGKAAPLPGRLNHFRKTAGSVVMFAMLSWLTALRVRIPLFPDSLPPLKAVAAGLAVYAALVAFMLPRWRRAVETGDPAVHLFMPRTAVERAWWIGVSLLAGIGEEITWRGVQTELIARLSGSLVTAALVCSLTFAVCHAQQGFKSMAVIFFLALGLHTLVWLAGSLYVAMAVHSLYNVTAGLCLGRLGRRLGYSIEAPKPVA